MKKKEYIEKYGVEAWEVEKKRRALEASRRWKREHPEQNREREKKYKQEHRTEILEKHKLYYQEHKDEISEKKRKYYAENADRLRETERLYREKNRDSILSRKKAYRDNNKESIAEYGRQWRAKNPGYLKEYYASRPEAVEKNRKRQKEFYKKNYYTQERRAMYLTNAYTFVDKKEGRGECTLTREWIIEHIFNSKCVYCGDSDWRHLGCDRIDNTLPHTPENCICACGLCNVEKGDRYSVEEFIEYRKTHPRVLELDHTPRVEVINGVIKKKAI